MTKTLSGRANATTKRARNTSELIKFNPKAKVLGPTGIDPAQVYGGTAVGVDEAIIKKQKQNMAAAFGKRAPKRSISNPCDRMGMGPEGTARRQSSHGTYQSVA